LDGVQGGCVGQLRRKKKHGKLVLFEPAKKCFTNL
jgi:hypothetical protein